MPVDRRPSPRRPPAVAAARQRRAPAFPFVALLVSGGHTPALRGRRRRPLPAARRHAGRRGRRSVRQDREAARAAVSGRSGARATRRGGHAGAVALPRPMLAVGRSRFQLLRTQDRRADARAPRSERRRPSTLPSAQGRHRARVPGARSSTCWSRNRSRRSTRPGCSTLVVAGGVGANRELRARLRARSRRAARRCSFPSSKFCTDNGAMIALVGALRLAAGASRSDYAFAVRPRWELASLTPGSSTRAA